MNANRRAGRRTAAARSRESSARVATALPSSAPDERATDVIPAPFLHDVHALEAIAAQAGDAIIATDLETRITFWAESAARLFGIAEHDAVGRRFTELLPSNIAEGGAEEHLLEVVASGRTWRGQGSVRLPTGRELWIESTVSPLVIDGRLSGHVTVSRDMTETHAAQREVADRARLFRILNDYTAIANAIHDEHALVPALIDAVRAVIPAKYVLLTLLVPSSGSYVVRAAHGIESAIGCTVRPGDGSNGRAIAARTLVVTEHLEKERYADAVRPDIDEEALTTAAVPLIHDGAVLGAIAVARPYGDGARFTWTEREALVLFGGQAALAVANVRLLDEISTMAVHDSLTGLYNRRHFDASLELLLARWRRSGRAEPLSAIMFDLDRFGKLNRDHGHQTGDSVLRTFGELLRERLRSSDLVARYGGEEFVVVLERTDLADAIRTADSIRIALEARQLTGPNGAEVRATVSAGVALLDPDEPSAETLLRAADVGLFMAKRAGRNRVIAA